MAPTFTGAVALFAVALFKGKEAVKKRLRGKVQNQDFPLRLEIPQEAAGFRTVSTATTRHFLLRSLFANSRPELVAFCID